MTGIVQIERHQLFDQSLMELSKHYPSLQDDLISDFHQYVSGQGLPQTFGRDSIFNEPYLAFRAMLRHIHIALPPATFHHSRNQVDRTNREGDPHNDAWLVYVKHAFYDNRYLILAIMHPDAHGQARDTAIMKKLGYIAQEFQDS